MTNKNLNPTPATRYGAVVTAVGVATVAVTAALPATAQVGRSAISDGDIGRDPTSVVAHRTRAGPPGSGGTSGRDAEFYLGVESGLLLSDNVRLEPSDSKESGAILEISPFVEAFVNRPRTQLDMRYRMRNFLYSHGEPEHDVARHQFQGLGNLALVGDWLWLGATGLLDDTPASPFGATSADPSTSRDNRARYVNFAVTPYARRRFDAATEGLLGAGVEYTRYGADQITSTTQSVRGRLLRDAQPGSFGYLVSGLTSRQDYEDGPEVDRGQLRLLGLTRVTGAMRVGAGAEYTRISVLEVDGDTSGWGPTVVLNWTPSQRTRLDLQYTKTYYGNTSSALLEHRAARMTYGLRFEDGITTGAGAALTFAGIGTPTLPGDEPSGIANPIATDMARQGDLPGTSLPLSSFFVSGALVDSRRLSGTVAWAATRNNVSLTAFRADNRTVATTVPLPVTSGPAELRQYGAIGSYTRRLTGDTSGNVLLSWTQSTDPAASRRSDLYYLLASVTTRLSPITSVRYGYRHARQNSSGPDTAEYVENALLAALYFRF